MSTSNGEHIAAPEPPVSRPYFQNNAPSAPSFNGSKLTAGAYIVFELLLIEVRNLDWLLRRAQKGDVKLGSHKEYIRRSMKDIQALIEQLDRDVPLNRQLHDLWEQIQECPLLKSPETELAADEQLHRFALLNDQIRQLAFQLNREVVPRQLDSCLVASRTGYSIPFHTLFSDQIPEIEDRVKLLNEYAYVPGSVKGLIDVEQGLIHRYAENIIVQAAQMALVIVALVGASIIVWASHGWLATLPEIPLQVPDIRMFLIAWFALLGGIALNRVVEALKGKRPPIVAIGEIGILVSAIHGRILFKLLLALIAFFGVTLTGLTELTLQNALLIGFSLDSVVEIFGSSVEKRSAMQVSAFKQQLGMGGTT